jgi:hypothetical protein
LDISQEKPQNKAAQKSQPIAMTIPHFLFNKSKTPPMIVGDKKPPKA